MSSQLKQLCHTILPGSKEDTPAEHFAKMAAWCEEHNVAHDVYGEGETIQAFEQKVADLLGYEAALFVITGTMTQPTVLELVTKEKRNPVVAMHPSSHIYVHERQGYQLQNRFSILPIGNQYQTWSLKDLKAWPDEIAAVLYELPMREIGGQLPDWESLEEIKSYCATNGIHLHMDGARLWETAAYYQKEYHQIAKGFDTAYVSLYKGINGLGGSMLLGSKEFVERASIWMKRQGGNVYHRTPYVVSAAMQFEQRLKQLPALFERTKQIYRILEEYPALVANPLQPQSNMLHLILPFSHEKALEVQKQLATEKGIWIGHPQVTGHPHQSVVEWYVGDNLLNMSDEELRAVFDALLNSFR
ncbi:threonine aldolase family protein [Vibrio coralliilyticus]|uniref:threonine aldolase family protein n=1 Tax=Vibrio coralliilyticus TaxID=190893 RepID=UPI001816E24F|nr:aminotransferase class I/II-fold pyridoxal phosphate-dependent enzyme [Vibrio coralliilyticus]NUW69333.1 aminotransferase class I/II-fold pyridoxal phosphate-dependent enzyme [Vibrio coralliilyticus]